MNASPNHRLDEQDVPSCGNRPLSSDAKLSTTDQRPANFYQNRSNLGLVHPPPIVHVAQQQMQLPHVPRNRPPMLQHQYPIQHQTHMGHLTSPQGRRGLPPSNYHVHSHLFPPVAKNPNSLSLPNNHSRHASQNNLNHRSNTLRQVQQPVPVISSNSSHMSHSSVMCRNHVQTPPNRQNHVHHVHSSNIHQPQVPVQLQYQHTNPHGHVHMQSNHHHPIHPHHKLPAVPYSYPPQYHTHVQPPPTKTQHHPSPQKLQLHSQQNNQHNLEVIQHQGLKHQPRHIQYPTNNVSGQTLSNSNVPYSNIIYDRSFVSKLPEGSKQHRENSQINTTNKMQGQRIEPEINSTSEILSNPNKINMNKVQKSRDISTNQSKIEKPQLIHANEENTNDNDNIAEPLKFFPPVSQKATSNDDCVPQSKKVNTRQFLVEVHKDSKNKADTKVVSSQRYSDNEQKDSEESLLLLNKDMKGEVSSNADVETKSSSNVIKPPTNLVQPRRGQYIIDGNDNDGKGGMENNLSKEKDYQLNESRDARKANNSIIKFPELSSSDKNREKTSNDARLKGTRNLSINSCVTNFHSNVVIENTVENIANDSITLQTENIGHQDGFSYNNINDMFKQDSLDTSKANVLTSKSDFFQNSLKPSNDASLSNNFKSMSPPPKIKRFYPPNYHGDHVVNISSTQAVRTKFDALKLLTPKHVVKAMPKDASCIFYIFDRRMNFDSFPPDVSFYALLRAWVQDDPYRKIPPPELNLLNYMNTNSYTPLKSWSMKKQEILNESDSITSVKCPKSNKLQNKQQVDICSSIFLKLDENKKEKRKDPKSLLLQHIKKAKQIKKIKQRKKRKLDDLCWKRMEAIGILRF